MKNRRTSGAPIDVHIALCIAIMLSFGLLTGFRSLVPGPEVQIQRSVLATDATGQGGDKTEGTAPSEESPPL